MAKPGAALFDLDDTLTDRAAMFEAFKKDYIRDNFPSLTGGRFTEACDLLHRLDSDGGYSRFETFDLFAQGMGVTGKSHEELLRYWNSHFPMYMHVLDGTRELLAGLRARGVKLALVTNGDSDLQNGKIDIAGLRASFDVIIVSGDEPFDKPDRRIFDLALSRLGADAADAVFTGDNLRTDIIGAQRAGIPDVWMNRFGMKKAYGITPSREVHSVRELIKLLGSWGEQ
jgi:putative hydrolase of the HAD superfamily